MAKIPDLPDNWADDAQQQWRQRKQDAHAATEDRLVRRAATRYGYDLPALVREARRNTNDGLLTFDQLLERYPEFPLGLRVRGFSGLQEGDPCWRLVTTLAKAPTKSLLYLGWAAVQDYYEGMGAAQDRYGLLFALPGISPQCCFHDHPTQGRGWRITVEVGKGEATQVFTLQRFDDMLDELNPLAT